MKNIFLVLAACFLTFASCTPFYNVKHKSYDSIEHPFSTDKVMFHLGSILEYYLVKTNYIDGGYFSIQIEYRGNRWLFMDGDITIQADSEIIRIKDAKPHRMTIYGGVSETIEAKIPEDDLIKIAKSSLLRIECFGSPVTVSERGISHINRFYNEFKNK